MSTLIRRTLSRANRLGLSPEALLTVAFGIAFGVWSWLTLRGHTHTLDLLTPPPHLPPRSYRGQVAEAASLLTHPIVTLLLITAIAIFSYQARMRRLALALAISAGGVLAQALLAVVINRPRPITAFSDSVSHMGGAYPASHVTTVTILAWVLVTLTRAHRRSTSIVARWALVGIGAVAATILAQWTMALIHLSDAVGGVLLGGAAANAALTIGGLATILSGWAHLGLPEGSVNKRAAVILNPTKVDDLSLLRRRVEAEVLSAGWQPTTWLETSPEDAGHAAARHAINLGVDLVLVAGGDGTVRAVSSELAGTGITMALLPSGTGNLLARNLAIPLDTDAALRLAFRGRSHPIDVLRAVYDGGEERFVVMAGMGLDAQIMEDTRDGLKKVIRAGAYAVAAVQHVIPRPFTVTVTVDNQAPSIHQTVMALLGNVGMIGGGVSLLPDASPSDGAVDLLIASPDRVTDWAKLGAQVVTGRDMGGFPTLRGTRIVIESDTPVPFELDGDTAGQITRLEVSVDPGALHVVMP